MVAFRRAFHGRTSAAVEVTDNPKIVSPLNSNNNVTFLPLNDIDAMCDELAKGDVAAVIIEGIQGVGGIRIPEADFLRVLREECNRYGTVLILDEIQSGYGRSGRFFAHQYSGIRPDIITCAKGIATRIPDGRSTDIPDVQAILRNARHNLRGNHLACATAIAVLDIIEGGTPR